MSGRTGSVYRMHLTQVSSVTLKPTRTALILTRQGSVERSRIIESALDAEYHIPETLTLRRKRFVDNLMDHYLFWVRQQG